MTLEKLDEQIKTKDNEINKLSKELSTINKERRKFIFDNKLYITDLSEFEGKEVSSIKVFDSKGDDVYIPSDEGVEIRNGRLFASSYMNGIFEYDDKTECYCYAFHYSYEELDIIGFYDLKLI